MFKKTKILNRNEAYYSQIPVVHNDRIYNMSDLLSIQLCFGIGAWFFLTGSQTGMWLPADKAIPTIIFGNCFPLFLMGTAAITSARYGVEQIASSIPVFGHRFTAINLVFFYSTLFPALALATLMFGKSAIRFWTTLFGTESVFSSYYTLWAFFALAIGFFLASRGPVVLLWFVRITAVLMLAILFILISYLVFYHGIDNILLMQPADPIIIPNNPLQSHLWNTASGLEINIGLGFSWALWYGQWTRLAKTESAAYHGCMWGWGLLATLAGIFSALSALAIQQYDPTAWMISIGAEMSLPVLPIVGLLLMGLANISSAATLIYPGAVSFRTHYPNVGWWPALLISTLPVIILIAPGTYERIAAIYSIVGLICAVYGAIVVSDYHFISKGVFSIRHIYNKKEGYQYAYGINPAAAIAIILGLAFYLNTLNPITWHSANGLFPYLTACLPTFFLTGTIYVLLMKLWILKKYPLPIKPESSEKKLPISDIDRNKM